MTAVDPDDRELRSTLGKAIRIRRVELDMTRADLAREGDVSYTYLSEIENGTKQASAKTIWRIARALGLEPHELLAAAAQWDRRSEASASDAMARGPGAPFTASRTEAPPPPPSAASRSGGARSQWFHSRHPASGEALAAARPVRVTDPSGTPELLEVLDRITAALDGVPDERAELALMLSLDERRTRRIVREEMDHRR